MDRLRNQRHHPYNRTAKLAAELAILKLAAAEALKEVQDSATALPEVVTTGQASTSESAAAISSVIGALERGKQRTKAKHKCAPAHARRTKNKSEQTIPVPSFQEPQVSIAQQDVAASQSSVRVPHVYVYQPPASMAIPIYRVPFVYTADAQDYTFDSSSLDLLLTSKLFRAFIVDSLFSSYFTDREFAYS